MKSTRLQNLTDSQFCGIHLSHKTDRSWHRFRQGYMEESVAHAADLFFMTLMFV